MKVYVLMWGCYDDHEICGVTNDLEVAEKWVAQDSDHYGSIEFMLNAQPEKIAHSCPHND